MADLSFNALSIGFVSDHFFRVYTAVNLAITVGDSEFPNVLNVVLNNQNIETGTGIYCLNSELTDYTKGFGKARPLWVIEIGR